jgi:catechol 2,3-dioxygenase-like lactoylglutathione lyase family enzyme
MLCHEKIMAFVPAKDPKRARAFYEGVLALHFVSEDEFAVVLNANGILVRVAKVEEFKPQQFTVLGWEVSNIEQVVSGLRERGVNLEKYGLEGQDERGIWTSPSGAKVAWFKDPDGNVLSVSQLM